MIDNNRAEYVDDLNKAKNNAGDEMNNSLGRLENPENGAQAPRQEEASKIDHQGSNSHLHNTRVSLAMKVDIVYVIDCTASMSSLHDKVKEITLNFHKELIKKWTEQMRNITSMRTKVIAFRDYYCDCDDPTHSPMSQSEFFTMPDQESEFKAFVNAIEPIGGGNGANSALEALHLAFKSDWHSHEYGEKSRKIVVLITNSGAHRLDDERRFHLDSDLHYPVDTPNKLEDMENEWNDPVLFSASANRPVTSNRLILFIPLDRYPWATIGRWDRTQSAMVSEQSLQYALNITDVFIH